MAAHMRIRSTLGAGTIVLVRLPLAGPPAITEENRTTNAA